MSFSRFCLCLCLKMRLSPYRKILIFKFVHLLNQAVKLLITWCIFFQEFCFHKHKENCTEALFHEIWQFTVYFFTLCIEIPNDVKNGRFPRDRTFVKCDQDVSGNYLVELTRKNGHNYVKVKGSYNDDQKRLSESSSNNSELTLSLLTDHRVYSVFYEKQPCVLFLLRANIYIICQEVWNISFL